MKILIIFLLLSLFIFVFTTCEKDHNKYIRNNKEKILYVKIDRDSVRADGKSTIKIRAAINNNSDNKTIFFSTTKGIFLDSAKSAIKLDATLLNDSLIAVTYLVSTTEEDSIVKLAVSVPEVDTVIFINFIRAFADSIHIESTTASIPKGFGSEVPIVTKLIRSVGTPSIHQYVTFTAYTNAGKRIGEFRGISPQGSSDSGMVTSVFVLKDTTYTGSLKIFASYQGENKILEDSLTVYITK